MLKFPESFERRPVCFTGRGGGNLGCVAAGGTAPGHVSAIATPTFIPNAFFCRKINNLLDDSGRLKDAELLGRLKAQAQWLHRFCRTAEKM